jgi:hypothetical protein
MFRRSDALKIGGTFIPKWCAKVLHQKWYNIHTKMVCRIDALKNGKTLMVPRPGIELPRIELPGIKLPGIKFYNINQGSNEQGSNYLRIET